MDQLHATQLLKGTYLMTLVPTDVGARVGFPR
jgi:hypothetical protein